MNKRLKILKRALRLHGQDENRHALLELNTLLDEYTDFAAAFCVRARVLESQSQYVAAIRDYILALSESNLNKRNTARIVQNVLVCSSRLKGEQKVALAKTLRDEFELDDFDLKDPYWNSESWSAILSRGLSNVLEAQERVLATPAHTGKIANIGKFLLDSNDVEKLTLLLSQNEKTSGTRTLTTYGNWPGFGPVPLPEQQRPI